MDPRFREGDKACAMRLFASSAARLHVTRQTMSAILNGHAGLSAEMAIRFEKAFGLKTDTMLRMQAAYDLAQVRARGREIVVNRVAAQSTYESKIYFIVPIMKRLIGSWAY